MKIDLTCPAEVWRTALPGAERPVCELTLYNLSDKLIVSVEVTLTLLDAAGEEIARVIHRAHDLHGLPEKPFSMLVPVEEETAALIYYNRLTPQEDPQIQAALECLK